MLTPNDIEELQRLIDAHHERRSASIEALGWVQKRYGWVDDQCLCQLADLLGLSSTALDSVATFYSLIFRRPVGRHVILVCDSISCWMISGRTISGYLKKRLGIDWGQTSADGLFTLLPIPCLGACHRAPAMMIDDQLHTFITEEKVERLLKRYS
jgi:NADH-quinone oxidoreductase subunit E